MVNSKIEKFKTLCRTCMGAKDSDESAKCKALIPIHEQLEINGYETITILELMKQTSPRLSADSKDMLPKSVCNICLETMLNIYEFQNSSLKAEDRLRELIKKSSPFPSPVFDGGYSCNNNEKEEHKNFQNIFEEPLIDVANEGRGIMSLLQKDGGVVEVYRDEGVGNRQDNNFSNKVKRETKDDNQSLAKFLKDIQAEEQQDMNDVQKGINIKDNEEANSYDELKEEHPDKKTEEIQNADLDRARKQQVNREVKSSSNKHNVEIKNPSDQEKATHDVSDHNESSTSDDSEWEHLSNKIKWRKSSDYRRKKETEEEHEALITRNFSCNKCGKTLKTRAILKMHLKRHLKRDEKKIKVDNGHICPECGTRLKTRVTFRRHMRMHERDETKIKYKCEYCNKVFNQSGALRYHERMHTGERPYLCSVCGKSFATQCGLKQHYARHETELKYQCPQCPKRFRSSSSMCTHKAIVHSNARPHVCDLCGAGFKKPYGLRKHKIIHGEKRHKCDYCDMKFAQLDQCRRHMRTHTGEKPYQCRYCDRAYAQSNDMIKHLRVHVGDNVYRCEMCPQAFRLLCELRAHFTTHKDDDEETKTSNLQALKEEEERIQTKIKSDLEKDQQL